jgi:hypothetical protein
MTCFKYKEDWQEEDCSHGILNIYNKNRPVVSNQPAQGKVVAGCRKNSKHKQRQSFGIVRKGSATVYYKDENPDERQNYSCIINQLKPLLQEYPRSDRSYYRDG